MPQESGPSGIDISDRSSLLQIADYEQNIAGLRVNFDDYSRDLHRHQGEDRNVPSQKWYKQLVELSQRLLSGFYLGHVSLREMQLRAQSSSG